MSDFKGFKQWVEEGTTCSSCGGGGFGTNMIAKFVRPVGIGTESKPVRRFSKFMKEKLSKEEVKEEELVESKLPFTYMSMADKMREQVIPKPDHDEFYEGKSSSSKKSAPVRRTPPPDPSVACPNCKKKVRKSKMVKVPDSLQEKYGAKTLCLECAKKKREKKKEED